MKYENYKTWNKKRYETIKKISLVKHEVLKLKYHEEVTPKMKKDLDKVVDTLFKSWELLLDADGTKRS